MLVFLQQVINGLAQGGIYSLIAIGWTTVFGIVGVINWTHGEIYMLGAYTGYFVTTYLGLPLIPALLISMAAGALVYLQGGDCTQIATAAAMAMKNLLGLVCDPVAGLVEVPCVKRNVIGTVNAMSAADMAMAGIVSRIPPDQVMDAMKEVGDKMDASLRETALGGLAHTEEGMKIAEKMHSSHENC